jgi:SAM-dependent methyltransferase
VGHNLGLARFVCGESRAVRSGIFDVAICSEVLEHVYDPQALLGDIRRLLRPGALCFVTVPNGYGPYEATDRAGKLAHAVLQRVGLERRGTKPRIHSYAGCDSLNHSSSHLQFFTTRALRRHFTATHFDEVDYQGRTFLCGALLSEGLAVHEALVGANQWAGSVLPPALVSGWMFVLRSKEAANTEYSG